MFIQPRRRMLGLTSAIALALLAPAALAGTQQGNFNLDTLQWYAGAHVGESRLRLNTSELASSFTELDSSMSDVTYHKDDTGFKVFVGTNLSDYFALELGYFRLGQVGFTSQLAVDLPETLLQAQTAMLDGHLKAQGLNLDAVARYPLTSQFAVLARLGATYNETNARIFVDVDGEGASFNQNKHDVNYKYGAGMEYSVNANWLVRLDMERYRLDEFWGDQGSFNFLSMGVVYRYD